MEVKKQPMTIKDFDELGINNYMLGEKNGRHFIIIIRCKKEPKLRAWPLLDNKESFECTKEMVEILEERKPII